MIIAIPTYLREDSQLCYERLPDCLKQNTILFTHNGRADILQEAQPDATVVDLGFPDGIAQVRQAVVDWCSENGHSKIFMCDDQCYFNKRTKDLKLKVMEQRDPAWLVMMDRLESHLDRFPMVGVSPRPGNNRVEKDLVEACRCYSCYALDTSALKAHELRFDGMELTHGVKLFEDFYMILSMLTRGISNAMVYNFAMYHTHGKPGGNHNWRTNKTQKEALEALQDIFPQFVKLRQIKSKTWTTSDGEDGIRWEPTIQWKKAYEHGISNQSDLL